MGTYRLQLNPRFTFKDVEDLLDYFSSLGVSHLYLSPVLKARPGSTHGYDVVDHSAINDELGGEEAYLNLLRKAKKAGLGVIQDIVPNHMSVHETNWRFQDLLRNWRESKYYDYFDHYCEDRIALPVLEDKLDEVLRKGLISVEGDWIVYKGMKFPINEEGKRIWSETGDLRKVLSSQHYELRFWREGPSYRRFFAVNELIALRAEREEVFKESHEYISRFPVSGFRVDHVDGLLDPGEYLRRLRGLVGDRTIYVEKILSLDERLEDWGVEGTTGYDFLNYANLLLVREPGRILEIFREFTGEELDPDRLIEECKRLVARTLFKSDIEYLSKLTGVDQEYLVEFLSCMKVYRTYYPRGMDEVRRCDKGGKIPEEILPRLEQYMPAIFAKGYEDTALFRYNPLISINEVGSDVRRLSLSMEEYHRFMTTRAETTMNATSTHDTKFSEDVRARISALSQFPEEWRERVLRWHDILKPKVDRNLEYRFYQTLVGSFEEFSEDYKRRLRDHMLKVAREAKVYTTWEDPNLEYEGKVMDVVEEAFNNSQFRKDFLEFVEMVKDPGYRNSLITVVLKLTSPGVPDIYQGTEVWRYLLTDPDNRMPVDFRHLREVMKSLPQSAKGWSIRDERLKMFLIREGLRLRRKGKLGKYKGRPFGYERGDVMVILSTNATGDLKLEGTYKDLLSGEERREVDVNEVKTWGFMVLVREESS
nr:malto-oligosyltrehalose synthase [Metallosphaera tengchongensis]